MTDWERVVLRACCATLQDSIALGRKIPNIQAAGVRLMLAGYTTAEIELFKMTAANVTATRPPTERPAP